MQSRTIRTLIGWVALLPVTFATGGILVAASLEGPITVWLALAAAVAWVAFILWWARQAEA